MGGKPSFFFIDEPQGKTVFLFSHQHMNSGLKLPAAYAPLNCLLHQSNGDKISYASWPFCSPQPLTLSYFIQAICHKVHPKRIESN